MFTMYLCKDVWWKRPEDNETEKRRYITGFLNT